MTPSDRLRQALEMMDFGFELQRQNLRRRHPEWTEEAIEEAFHHWLVDRPMHPQVPAPRK